MKRRFVFGAGGVIVAALSVLAAVAVGAFASGSPTKSAGQATVPSTGIAAPSAAQVASFPVLGQAATSGEASTSPEAVQMLEGQYHANPSLGRNVVSNAVATAVVVPGEGAVCLVILGHVGASSSVCEPEAGASKEGLGMVEALPSGKYVIAGVKPASDAGSTVVVTDEAGQETTIKLNAQNGYAFEVSGKPVKTDWIGSNGTQSSTALPKE